MIDPAPAALRSSLEQLLANPTADDLWQFQKALLVVGGPEPAHARSRACIPVVPPDAREQVSLSRSERLGAVLGTAAVASLSLPKMRNLT